MKRSQANPSVFASASTVPASSSRGDGEQRDRGAERNMFGQVRGHVDDGGDDQRQGQHPELGDGWQAALVHPAASLVMMISVATCIRPVAPAV